ncbi:MAG: aminotransferase class I/II-fold pyridoxal phosphate-dependent enzyme, partial [Candidatus Micrarchaeota archaeon]|nr:aminotransferase class I/II-fold pyridoxal phosphate-dependent enzyme [Candidatus Micrarchaeota archaeon]
MNIRTAVRAMTAYAWEESSASIARRFGLQEGDVIRFDMNTNPVILPAVAQALARLGKEPVNEYPAPDYGNVVAGIGRYLGVDENQVVLGAGGDEVIDVIAKAFLEKGDTSVISTPTYSMFKIASQSYGAKVVEVPRGPDFSVDVEALADAAKKSKLLWVCNPNSPTGNAEPISKIQALLESTSATVVVDEAYAEFGGQSAVPLVGRFENLLVVRTLSKAFGLAGA